MSAAGKFEIVNTDDRPISKSAERQDVVSANDVGSGRDSSSDRKFLRRSSRPLDRRLVRNHHAASDVSRMFNGLSATIRRASFFAKLIFFLSSFRNVHRRPAAVKS
jgi:hypothetical protein